MEDEERDLGLGFSKKKKKRKEKSNNIGFLSSHTKYETRQSNFRVCDGNLVVLWMI